MKRFDKIKTLQLILFVILVISSLLLVFRDAELFHLIATNGHVKAMCFLLWIVFLLCFAFLFFDFNSFSRVKREYSELDRAVYSDPMTGIANRYSCDAFIEQYLDQPLPENLGCITFDMTNLQEINESYGHLGGNNAIRDFSSILQSASINLCFVGRNGGNKFLAIFSDCTQEKLDQYLALVEQKLNHHNETSNKKEILYRFGIAFREGDQVKNITELIALSSRRASDQ